MIPKKIEKWKMLRKHHHHKKMRPAI